MEPSQSTADFDSRARTWDDDPMKAARAQAVADGILRLVPLAPHMAGLEYGCGTGLLSFALQRHLQEISLADSSSGMLEVLREKIASHGIGNMRPITLDLVTDPLPEEKYDIIYTLMTLHHIVDTEKVLRDLHAMLDRPGYLCIADLDSEDGSFHGPGFTGHNGFDRADLEQKANQAGFRNVLFTTIFHITKGEEPKTFPVFLMVAEKS